MFEKMLYMEEIQRGRIIGLGEQKLPDSMESTEELFQKVIQYFHSWKTEKIHGGEAVVILQPNF